MAKTTEYTKSTKMVSSLPAAGQVQGIIYFRMTDYTMHIWNGVEFVQLNKTTVTQIPADATNDDIPTTKAVADYVNAKVAAVEGIKGKFVTDVTYNAGVLSVAKGDEPVTTTMTGIVHEPTYDAETRTIKLPVFGGDTLTIALGKDLVVKSGIYNTETHEIELTITTGEVIKIPVGSLIDIYIGVATSTATVTVSDDNKISVDVRVSAKANNSITIEEDGLYVAVPDAYTKSETDAKIKKVQDQLDGHSKDAVVHITAEERKSNVGHTHDYLPTAGGTMNGTITFSDSSHGKIYSGPTDNVNGPGGDLNNIVIESWNGLSFTTGCPNQTYTGKTAVGIDCREGVVKAARFDGTLTGTAATLGGGGNPYAPMTFNWSGKDGQPTWLWGGEDGTNMYVYNPGNFKVNWAQSAANGVYANGFDGSGGGYIRFCNGAQICWGRTNCSGKDTTINFSAAFSNSSYSVSTMPFYSSLADTYWNVKEGSMGTTGFVLHGSKSSIDLRTMLWIAIGKWN